MTRDPDPSLPLLEAGEHVLPASFFGPPGAVEVHVLVGTGDAALLTDEERYRAAGFGSAKRRDEFVRGRALLRRVAAGWLDVQPHLVPLARAPGGGFLPLGGALHVSLTHTADLAAVAFSNAPIGLDVERVRSVHPELARRLLAPGEVLPDVPDALLHVWTAKEAVLKATGEGLRGGLRRLSLRWEARHEEESLARAQGSNGWYRVGVRRYHNLNWALARAETVA